MIDLFKEAIKPAVENEFARGFDQRERRAQVSNALYTWLVNKARKRQVPDLADRLEKMRVRIDRMVEHMEIKFVNNKPVVKVAGSSEDTLKALRLGTDWFVGTDDVVELVVTGLFDE